MGNGHLKALMIQGCTSNAGKSALVAGLARLLSRRGVRVAPFKPQNMANNSAVTVDGGEIGRAQAVQAQAAGVQPHSDMNPILLKPSSERNSQIVINGQAVGNMDARRYHHAKAELGRYAVEAFRRLAARFELVLIEGAGSPAEVNLRANDFANMGFAQAVDCPVWLVADIERGGVFAHLVGTLEVLEPSERDRVEGFVINRFRGDVGLLEPGNRWLEARTGKPVIGTVPYIDNLHLEAEDSVDLRRKTNPAFSRSNGRLKVAALAFPRIANHTDLDPLALHPQVDVQWVQPGEPLPGTDLVVLPGSKSVRSDLARAREYDWHRALSRHLRYGGKVIGICGGYQMLGKRVHDRLGIEGSPGSCDGLGMLDVETRIESSKALTMVEGELVFDNARVSGYEIHMGRDRGGRPRATGRVPGGPTRRKRFQGRTGARHLSARAVRRARSTRCAAELGRAGAR